MASTLIKLYQLSYILCYPVLVRPYTHAICVAVSGSSRHCLQISVSTIFILTRWSFHALPPIWPWVFEPAYTYWHPSTISGLISSTIAVPSLSIHYYPPVLYWTEIFYRCPFWSAAAFPAVHMCILTPINTSLTEAQPALVWSIGSPAL